MNSILKHFLTFGGFTLLSRIFGFIRDALITHFLGKSVWCDLFIIAYKSTNWVRRFFAEGAMNVSLIPELVKRQNDPEKFAKLLQNTFSLILFGLGFFVIILEIFVPIITPLMVTKYQGVELAHLIRLLQINLPYALLISLCAICNAFLNIHHKFYAESSLPIILNLSVIASVLLFRNSDGQTITFGMSWGVIIAGIIQFSWLYGLCKKNHFTFRIQMPQFQSEETALIVKRTSRNSLISFANQINLFVDLYLATLLPAGAVTLLHTADRLNQFPLSIIGVALSVVLLPNFSKIIDNAKETKILFHNAIIGALQLALPITFLLILLADPLFYILYYHGKFTLMDTLQASRTLQCYAFGIPFVIVSKIFLSFLFARNASKIALYAAMGSVAINIMMSISLMPFVGHYGIAMATAIAAFFNCLILMIYTYVDFPQLFETVKDIFTLILWSAFTFIMIFIGKKAFFSPLYSSRFENFQLVLAITTLFLLLYYGVGYFFKFIQMPSQISKK